MNHIEQAIFTSAQTPRGDGYQLVARSPGVSEEEAHELTVWGPSHDSLRELHAGSTCYSYFPLQSGNWCVSRTIADGGEYSRRGGYRITTQFLVVAPAIVNRFGNNPLAIVKAALADGLWRRTDERIKHLPAVHLGGKASIIDRTAIDRVRVRIGPENLAWMVEAVLSHAPVLISGGPAPELVTAALISCLPPECRGELSFTSGLRYSQCRPFRLLFAPHDPRERRQLVRQSGCLLVDISRRRSSDQPLNHGWARFIHDVLQTNRVSALSAQFMQARPGLRFRDLDLLGQQLLDELRQWKEHEADHAALVLGGVAAAPELEPEDDFADDSGLPIPAAETLDTSSVIPPGEPNPAPPPPDLVKTHAAHARFEQSQRNAASTGRPGAAVAEPIAASAPSRLPQQTLEHLDDLVFGSINGNLELLAELKQIWPALVAEIGPEAVEESREQYLRRALAVWNEVGGEHPRDPHRATAALDVLCLLLGDEHPAPA